MAQEGKDGAAASQTRSPAELKEVLKQLKLEEPPKSPEEKETYFMSQVGLGEQLALQGTVLISLRRTLSNVTKALLFIFLLLWLSTVLFGSIRRLSSSLSSIKRPFLNPYSKCAQL